MCKTNKNLKIIAREFCEETTIHGIRHFVSNTHIFEILFWIFVFILSIFGIVGISWNNWRRYQANPTVVTLETDYRQWENLFPAVTVCLTKRADTELTKKYIKMIWNVSSNQENYTLYKTFVKAVANMSYDNMHQMKEFLNMKEFNNIDMVNLSISVHPKMNYVFHLNFEKKDDKERTWKKLVTELGLCHSYNSIIASHLSSRVQSINTEFDQPLACHYLIYICSGTITTPTINGNAKFYIHSPFDIATYDSPATEIKNYFVFRRDYKPMESLSTRRLNDLTPKQRGCRFISEPNDPWVNIYSPSTCQMACRIRLAENKCGCHPFFYQTSGAVCDVKGLYCLSKYVQELIEVKKRCICPPACHDVTFLTDYELSFDRANDWSASGISFVLKLTPATLRTKRDIIFGFDDLIVSFGGIAAFFLGISFLSIIEIGFFLISNSIELFSSNFIN